MPNISLDMDRMKEQLILHEGYRTHTYRDSKGIPTVGVGFNLSRKDARYLLTEAGADYDSVLAGNNELTDDQIQFLLEYNIKEAVQGAKALVANFDELSGVRKRVIVDMVFNLGFRGFAKFHRTRQAIVDFEYAVAAQNMRESLWCGQVKSRCTRLSIMMELGIDYEL